MSEATFLSSGRARRSNLHLRQLVLRQRRLCAAAIVVIHVVNVASVRDPEELHRIVARGELRSASYSEILAAHELESFFVNFGEFVLTEQNMRRCRLCR